MLSPGNNTNGERFKCVCGLSAGKQREVRCFENQRIGSAGPFSVSLYMLHPEQNHGRVNVRRGLIVLFFHLLT